MPSDHLLELIAACNSEGWFINNLFQLDTGEWQANLRSATHFTTFGHGPDPVSALDAALDAADNCIPRPATAAPTWSIAGQSQSPTDLLSLLNLKPKPLPPGSVRRL